MNSNTTDLTMWRRVRLAGAKFFGLASSELLVGGDEIDWGAYYSGAGGSQWVRWIDRKKAAELESVFAGLDSGASVLEIGCGTGSTVSSLPSHGRLNLIGIEPDPNLGGQAIANGFQILNGDFNTALPFLDQSFDAVIMIDVIEHVRSRLAMIKEIRRILKKKGVVVLFTPPYDSVCWILGEHLVYFLTGRLHVGHISPFTSESLAWLLRTEFNEVTITRLNWGLTMMGIGKAGKSPIVGDQLAGHSEVKEPLR